MSRAPDPPDSDVVARIVVELAGIARGPIDPDREPPLPLTMNGDHDVCR